MGRARWSGPSRKQTPAPGDTAWAMSEENEEQVREAWKAYIERGVDGLLDLYAEDCVCEDFPDMPDRATYEGRDGRDRWRGISE